MTQTQVIGEAPDPKEETSAVPKESLAQGRLKGAITAVSGHREEQTVVLGGQHLCNSELANVLSTQADPADENPGSSADPAGDNPGYEGNRVQYSTVCYAGVQPSIDDAHASTEGYLRPDQVEMIHRKKQGAIARRRMKLQHTAHRQDNEPYVNEDQLRQQDDEQHAEYEDDIQPEVTQDGSDNQPDMNGTDLLLHDRSTQIMECPRLENWCSEVMFKAGRIAYKHPPEWRHGSRWPPTKAIIRQDGIDHIMPMINPKATPQYMERLVTCGCGTVTTTNTTAMQMWHNVGGMRNIVCSRCHKQNRTQNWKCEWGHLCHKCSLHKVDPLVHKSRRTNGKNNEVKGREELLTTRRPKPVLKQKVGGTSHTNTKRSLNSYLKNLQSKPWRLTSRLISYGLSKSACPNLYSKFARSGNRHVKQDDEAAIPSEVDQPMSHPHLGKPPSGRETHLLNSETGVREPASDSHTNVCGLFEHGGSRSIGTMLPLREDSVRIESKAPPDPHRGRGECHAEN